MPRARLRPWLALSMTGPAGRLRQFASTTSTFRPVSAITLANCAATSDAPAPGVSGATPITQPPRWLPPSCSTTASLAMAS